jgi:hypothetical protein
MNAYRVQAEERIRKGRKICRVCQHDKYLEEFGKVKTVIDGRSHICLECMGKVKYERRDSIHIH